MEKAEGSITVTPPSELDNADPFVLDTMTVRVPTKIIGRTVDINPTTHAAEIRASSPANSNDRYPPNDTPTHPIRFASTPGRDTR